jgi:hypothetical protein
MLLNDFRNFPSNLLGGSCGDDKTMLRVIPNPDSQSVSLTSKDSGSYFFEEGFCPLQSSFQSLDLIVTTFAQGTYFAVNFQTSDSCTGPRKANYVFPFKDGFKIEAGVESRVSIPVPAAKGLLVGIAIEDLQPFGEAINIGSMTLICSSAKSIGASLMLLMTALLL